MTPKSFIKKLHQRFIEQHRIRKYEKLYQQMVEQTPHYKHVVSKPGEREWLNRWQPLLKHHKLSPLSYRIFSQMAGESIDRLPLEVCVNVVEPILNPRKYTAYYDDKNSLPRIIHQDWLPKTHLRSIHGHLFNGEGCIVTDVSKIIESISSDCIIIKPSCEQSGRNVQIFRRRGSGSFYNKNDEELSMNLLKHKWGDDWLIQERLEQSDELAKFNPTSVNTIRVATYRSIDGSTHPIGHVLRVGRKGSEVDNAHAGGMFCGIGADGHLGRYFCDALARTKTIFNGIDLTNTEYIISNMENIRQFVCKAASSIQHHDLVAFDIAITRDGTPKIIEINIGGFSAWLFEMTQQSTFGPFTEEVIKRCVDKCK